MRILLYDRFGDSTITRADGAVLHGQILPLLQDEQDVVLDFDRVEVFASPFFNAAIGDLLRRLTPEDLRAHLHIENLTISGSQVLERVIVQAKQVNEQPEGFRRAMESCLEEM